MAVQTGTPPEGAADSATGTPSTGPRDAVSVASQPPTDVREAVRSRSLSRPVPSTVSTDVRLPLIVGLIVVSVVTALWPSVASLLDFWGEIHDYQQGYLIAGIAVIWLVLEARRLRPGGSQTVVVATGMLAGSLLVWLIALRSNSLILHQMMVPAVLWSAILATTDPRVARRLLLPVAFIYFSIPVWEYLVPLLRQLSIFAAESMLGLAGVHAIVRESTVTIPEGTFRIVEGCSGKRYFMVALAVAFLAGAIHGMRRWRYVGFMAACGGLALLANWVRIFVVIYAGHVTNMKHYLVAKEHITFGNAIFVVLLLGVFFLARRVSHVGAVEQVDSSSAAARAESGPGSAFRWSALLPLALLAGTFWLVQAAETTTARSPALGYLPLATGDWQGPLPARAEWQPHFIAPLAEVRAAYVSQGGVAVDVYVNLYGHQVQGQELVHYANSLFPGDLWEREWPQTSTAIVSRSGHRAYSFRARAGDGSSWLITYVYDIGGWLTGSDALAQLAYGARSILQPIPSGVIALAARCEPNCEAAQALVQSFWDDMSDPLLGMVPDAPG